MEQINQDRLPKLVSGVREMQLNPLTLSFSGSNTYLEEEFSTYYFNKYLIQMRSGIMLAALFYGLFAILDIYMAPELSAVFWVIRFGVVLPVAFLAFIFSYTPLFRRFHQNAMFSLILTGGGGIIAMIVLSQPPHDLFLLCRSDSGSDFRLYIHRASLYLVHGGRLDPDSDVSDCRHFDHAYTVSDRDQQ